MHQSSTQFEKLLKKAQLGKPSAQCRVGMMYEEGKEIEKNEVLACEWYRRAAEQGYAKAQFYLAVMYEMGAGVEKSVTAALDWYLKAANQNYKDAQYNLGVINEMGQEVPVNLEQAIFWYKKAAENGDAEANEECQRLLKEYPQLENPENLSALLITNPEVSDETVEEKDNLHSKTDSEDLGDIKIGSKTKFDYSIVRSETIHIVTEPYSHRANNFWKFILCLPLFLDPLNCYFFYVAMLETMKSFLEESDTQDNEFVGGALFFMCAASTVLSYFCDILLINPIEEAEALSGPNQYQMYDPQLSDNLSNIEGKCEKGSIKGLVIFNLLIANSNYIVVSATSAISVAYLTSIKELRWILGIIFTTSGMLFCNMLGRNILNDHAFKFLHRLLNCESSMLWDMFKAPLQSFELIIQTLTNSAYKSISAAYIMQQLIQEYWNDDEEVNLNEDNGFILYAIATSFYINLFFRTLSTHQVYFITKEDFKKIPNHILSKTKIYSKHLLMDGVFCMVRTSSAMILLYKYGPEDKTWNIVIVTGAGVCLMSQGIFARYNARRFHAATKIMEKESISNLHLHNRSAVQQFDLIQARFKTKGLKRVVTLINAGTISGGWLAFFGFLKSLSDLLAKNGGSALTFVDLICLQQLWGTMSLENDALFYQELMIENLSYHRAKIFMERQHPHFGLGKSFFRAKAEYSQQYLSQFLNEEPILPRPVTYLRAIENKRSTWSELEEEDMLLDPIKNVVYGST